MKKEFPAGKGFADLVFRPRKNNSDLAMIVELKYDKSAESAIELIKKKLYDDYLKNYSRKINVIYFIVARHLVVTK